MTYQTSTIPKGWKMTTLGEVADVNSSTIDKNYTFNEIEYIDVASVEERKLTETQKLKLENAPSRAKRIVVDNSVLISTVRPNLKHYCFVKKAKPNLIASTGFAVVNSKEGKSDPYYLYNLLTTNEYTNYLIKIADSQTSTYPAFNPSIIQNSKFIFPSFPEQRAIAAVLLSLDDKIELLREQNKTLEATAQAIFKEKIVSKTQEVLPKGWIMGRLSDIANFLNGIALQKYPAAKGTDSFPAIKIKELKAGITNATDRVSKDLPEQYIVHDGDVIFLWPGSLEVVIWQYSEGALNQHLFKVTSEKYPKWFYYFWLLRHLPNFRAIAANKATTMGHIQRYHLDKAQVVIPDDATIKELNALMEPILNKVILNHSQVKGLAKLRDTLLPKLMSGKIRV